MAISQSQLQFHNDTWTPVEHINRFEMFKYNYPHRPNPMQQKSGKKK